MKIIFYKNRNLKINLSSYTQSATKLKLFWNIEPKRKFMKICRIRQVRGYLGIGKNVLNGILIENLNY